MDNAVALSAIALAGTITAGFFAMVNKLNKTHDKLAKAMERVAKATEKTAKEAKERNGQLGELVLQGNKLTGRIVARLEKTADIAAEDRDVLTNQNKHIKAEVTRIMKTEIVPETGIKE